MTVPVIFEAGPAKPASRYPGPRLPVSLVNAGSQQVQPPAPGQLLTVHGLNLAQQQEPEPDVQVFFDGVPAPVLYAASTQLNVDVPSEIAGR